MANTRRELLHWAQKGRCHYCDCKMTLSVPRPGDRPSEFMCTIDHVTPVALGGGDEIENTVAACNLCNNSRGTIRYAAFRWFVKTYGRKAHPVQTFRVLHRDGKIVDNLSYWHDLLTPPGLTMAVTKMNLGDLRKLEIIKQAKIVPVNEPKWRERRRYLTLSRRAVKDIVNSMPYQTKNVAWIKYLREEKGDAIHPHR